MRFYTKQHLFYCGVDLHTRSMYICVLDQSGQILLHRNLPAEPQRFLDAIGPWQVRPREPGTSIGVCVGQQLPTPTSEKRSQAVKP